VAVQLVKLILFAKFVQVVWPVHIVLQVLNAMHYLAGPFNRIAPIFLVVIQTVQHVKLAVVITAKHKLELIHAQ